MSLGFGDSGNVQGRSAYIDNLHYAAIETPGTTHVSVWTPASQPDESDPLSAPSASSTSYLVSGDQLGVTQFFPETFQETSQGSGVRPFCANCDFLKWGAWGTRTDFADPNSDNATSTANVHLGWWVAADFRPRLISTRWPRYKPRPTMTGMLSAMSQASPTINGRLMSPPAIFQWTGISPAATDSSPSAISTIGASPLARAA